MVSACFIVKSENHVTLGWTLKSRNSVYRCINMTTKKTNDKEYKQIIRQHTKKKKNTTKQSKQTNDKEYKQKSNRIQKETNKNNVF